MRLVIDLLMLALLIVGAIYLPIDVENSGEALAWWERNLAIVDRETFLVLLSGGLLARLFWIDLRPLVFEYWPRRRRLDDFERPDGWSVSFKSAKTIGPSAVNTQRPMIAPSGVSLAFSDSETLISALLAKGAWFHNHSQKQTRIVNVSILVKGKDNAEFVARPRRSPRREDAIKFPLELPPQKFIEGIIEFEVPHGVSLSWPYNRLFEWAILDCEFTCTETVSGKEKCIVIGEEYDAYTNRVRLKRDPES